MPMYTYRCSECDCVFDQLRSMSDRDNTKELQCKNCSCKGSSKRIMQNSVSLKFKGSGFYCTENKTAEYRNAQAKEKI